MLTRYSYGGYSHGSSILRTMEHAAVWSAVRRVVDRLPMPVIVVGLVVIVAVIAMHRLTRRVRPRRRRPARR